MNALRKPLFPIAAVVLQLILMQALVAQDTGSSQDRDEALTTFKSQVDVVQLFFNVKDKKGGLIAGLTKNDFQILEDGKPQAVKYFAAESNLPLTLGILIDSSPSQERVLGMEKEVGASFLQEILRDKDLAFVIGFDAEIELLQDFTNSIPSLRKGLNRARIGTGGATPPIPGVSGPFPTADRPCCTALYDAAYLAAHDELAQQVGRKAVILLTDGEDEGSRLKLKDAIEAAHKADTICYVLLVADRGFYGMMGYSGDSAMKKMAQETGGRVIEVGNKPEKLKKAFDDIAAELRSQYNIGYVPINTTRDGGFRKVEIKTAKDYKVQARSGYYAVARD
jgi:VWFA-related protein